MARIVFVWELGAAYGHISGFMPLAKEFLSRGHEIICIIKDLKLAYTQLMPDNIQYFQAPVWDETITGKTSTSTYAELLLEIGYKQADQLCARILAWQTLYDTIQPDLVIADHAPTALLAARKYHFRVALFGTGFFSPPQQQPIPPFTDSPGLSLQQVDEFESRVTTCINSALHDLDMQPLTFLAELFNVDENFLTTYEELDHYKHRQGQHYWGLRFNPELGTSIIWTHQYERKIFAYINTGFPELEKLLQALLVIEADVILFSDGLSDILIKKYSASHITYTTQPVNFKSIQNDCDLVLSHAGLGTVGSMLLKGIPLFLLPMHAEQLIVAKRTHELGACEYFTPKDPSRNYRKAIYRLLRNASYKQNALIFSKKYKNFNEYQQQTNIIDRCEEMLR